jgi:hypothetical protein
MKIFLLSSRKQAPMRSAQHQDTDMRNLLILALSLATLGTSFASPASADVWRCDSHIFGQSRNDGPGTNTFGSGWSPFGGHVTQCTRYNDPPAKPASPWANATGVNKSHGSSTASHQK